MTREGKTDDVWLSPDGCSLADLAKEVESRGGALECPLADGVEQGIPVYRGASVARVLDEGGDLRPLMSEWSRVLSSGPGVVVFERAMADEQVLDEATAVFAEIIRVERQRGAGGDHFAESGANSRIWNSHEKLCVKAPETFVRYNAHDVVPAISRAWLGPSYQVTAQVNVVLPGGEAQRPHRDYHMGFQTAQELEQYPAHVHRMTPLLTLQGAVAHCDMPPETGPTKLLPYSHLYVSGYLATGQPEFQAYFEEHHVQPTLKKGDMLFFNPAVFHAAGSNKTRDVARMANLLQISSSYGRAMEVVDRARMSATVYPVLMDLRRRGVLGERESDNVVSATAEGYAFPVNLDRDPPVYGMAPPSQQDLMRKALAEGWDERRFRDALAEHEERRRTH